MNVLVTCFLSMIKKGKYARWTTIFLLVITSIVTNFVEKHSIQFEKSFTCRVKAAYKNHTTDVRNCMLYNTDRKYHDLKYHIERYLIFVSPLEIFMEVDGQTGILNKTMLETVVKNCINSPNLDILSCGYKFQRPKIDCFYK